MRANVNDISLWQFLLQDDDGLSKPTKPALLLPDSRK
jgi:hypothetical protein